MNQHFAAIDHRGFPFGRKKQGAIKWGGQKFGPYLRVLMSLLLLTASSSIHRAFFLNLGFGLAVNAFDPRSETAKKASLSGSKGSRWHTFSNFSWKGESLGGNQGANHSDWKSRQLSSRWWWQWSWLWVSSHLLYYEYSYTAPYCPCFLPSCFLAVLSWSLDNLPFIPQMLTPISLSFVLPSCFRSIRFQTCIMFNLPVEVLYLSHPERLEEKTSVTAFSPISA